MSRGTLDPALSARFSCTGLSPSLAGFPKTFPLNSLNQFRGPNPGMLARRFGLFPFRSPLLWESHVVFFSSPYLDVSVQAVPFHTLWIGVWMTEVCSVGFPHSDISGSLDICSSPKLFAAYHVFHRLLVPRHPPCALSSLTNFYILHSVAGVGSGCLCSQTVHLSMLLFLLGCLVSIFCVRYLCILLYAIFKVQKFDKVCFRFRWALSTSCFAHGYAPHILRLCHPSGCLRASSTHPAICPRPQLR